MATAPTGDETLKPDDAVDVLAKLLDAQNHSYILGLTFKLPPAEVEAIHSTYLKPRDRLLHILIAFLKQVQPRPTWRVIVDALRSPVVNLPALAKRVESVHIPDLTTKCDAIPETTTDGEAVASTTFVTENAALQSRVQELQQQLQFSERERQTIRQQLETELTRAEEASRREQQQRQQNNRELAQTQQQQQLSYTYRVSGPGLQSATVNHLTHVIVELTDSSGRSARLLHNITANLSEVAKTSRWPWSKNPKKQVSIVMTTPSRCEVSYTAGSRGQHELHVQVSNRELIGSPFTITVYPDPTQLGRPVRTVTGLNRPYGIAFNSRGEAVISEWFDHRVSIFDIRGEKIRTFGSHGSSPHQMEWPAGIAIDAMDNIYVSSQHKLQKFASSGELIKCIGHKGRKDGEFDDPRGVTLYNNQVYVCDRNNHHIEVFDLDLNSIGSYGTGGGEPLDVQFDTAGNMYVAEYGNKRVQVMDISGHCIRSFGQEGEGKLGGPSGLHIADKFVYVSDWSHHCIVVYETSGHFVTKFGRSGHEEGELNCPFCITSCTDGYIFVCDLWNNRIQIF